MPRRTDLRHPAAARTRRSPNHLHLHRRARRGPLRGARRGRSPLKAPPPVMARRRGAIGRVGEDATPMTKRTVSWITHPFALWEDPADTEKNSSGPARSAATSPATPTAASTSTSSATKARTESAPPTATTSTSVSPPSRHSGTRPTASEATRTSNPSESLRTADRLSRQAQADPRPQYSRTTADLIGSWPVPPVVFGQGRSVRSWPAMVNVGRWWMWS